jgi:hypothetical protein
MCCRSCSVCTHLTHHTSASARTTSTAQAQSLLRLRFALVTDRPSLSQPNSHPPTADLRLRRPQRWRLWLCSRAPPPTSACTRRGVRARCPPCTSTRPSPSLHRSSTRFRCPKLPHRTAFTPLSRTALRFSRLPEHRWRMQGLVHREGGVRPGPRTPCPDVIPLQRSTSPHSGHPHITYRPLASHATLSRCPLSHATVSRRPLSRHPLAPPSYAALSRHPLTSPSHAAFSLTPLSHAALMPSS